ncbi:MAG TPA: acyl-CoA dehydrogenase family protein, partial [Dehalococcoidia bacterium]|nr:acyl-CoA dehydrogenase family protein [Dehalococcoidia bacterium]
PTVAAAKVLATNTAIEVVEAAMRLVGGVALQRSEPLERYFRDVRGGIINPPIEARALEQIARAALDGDEPGSITPRLD